MIIGNFSVHCNFINIIDVLFFISIINSSIVICVRKVHLFSIITACDNVLYRIYIIICHPESGFVPVLCLSIDRCLMKTLDVNMFANCFKYFDSCGITCGAFPGSIST